MKKGIVIGAGIGGLTTAIALLKKGIDVTVFEQAPQLNEVGAGLWVAPNGMKVFDKLHLSKEVMLAGTSLEKIEVRDWRGRVVSSILGEKVKAKHQFATTAIHRAKLQQILYRQLPAEKVILNKRFVSFDQDSEQIRAFFADGKSVSADFLLLADGIKSIFNLNLFSNLQLRYSGQTCWRFVVDFQLPSEVRHEMHEIWSQKRGLRVGYSQINADQVYVYITNFQKAGETDDALTVLDQLLVLCSEFPAIVIEILKATRSKQIIRNDLYDFPPLTSWANGRMALLGDAAHATTPNLGQGACQAIEDAFVIANELHANEDVFQALKSYEQKRIKKATYITNTSWRFGQVTNTTGILKSILVSLLRSTPEAVNEKQLDKIYSASYFSRLG
jgi:2-polyprenyl-6-methoxyphenol hydroxylase-like FAD-dependent oxidoreductase